MRAPDDLAYGLDLADADPASLGAALATVALELARRPPRALQAATELALEQSAVALSTARRLLGADGEAAPAPGDARFSDRAWAENPLLRALLESYLVSADWSRRIVETLELPEQTRGKARFAL